MQNKIRAIRRFRFLLAFKTERTALPRYFSWLVNFFWTFFFTSMWTLNELQERLAFLSELIFRMPTEGNCWLRMSEWHLGQVSRNCGGNLQFCWFTCTELNPYTTRYKFILWWTNHFSIIIIFLKPCLFIKVIGQPGATQRTDIRTENIGIAVR